MLTYIVDIAFGPELKGYIAHPYWSEMSKVIEIEKQSGMNRAKSGESRRKALETFLSANNLTLSYYEQLKKKASEPFYRNGKSEIIIPENQLTAFLVATCDTAKASIRPCPPDQVRSRFRISDFTTGKTDADGVFSRFAIVQTGTGQKLSNQRGLRENSYIRDFIAHGTITFDEAFVDPKTLRNAIEWGGREIGVGASRKMGYGRFTLVGFKQETK